ncbi:MAG TPA: histidinol dehydrogenase [Planctomycetota bacterium]|nr:histidinol dehydrogenase [Planctomycetota bacterium]
MSLIPAVRFPSSQARRALAKLGGRLGAMERLDSAEYRARVKKLFGKVLPPDAVVSRILSDVRSKGDAALFGYAQRIDGVKLSKKNLRVSDAERRAAFRRTSPALRAALELAAERIADYQRRLLPGNIPLAPASGGPPGVKTGLSWSPLRRAGVYVPGGTAAYPSSVLMNAIPAQVAGVEEIAVATPCDRDGAVSDGVLCACEILKIEEIYRIGGAQAIGAFAYGTESIPRVDKIVGPGNLFVMLAKRAVFGQVDIDMLAGPSEVLVLADESAKPSFVAADLLAQAEHDPLASCVLVTDSVKLATAVQAELKRQLADLPRAAIAAASLRDWGLIVVTRNMKNAISVANEFAPEHLEILTRKPRELAPQLTTAGAIFLGPYATEPLGDYLAGPSHTLPTAATARAFSGLSVYTFLRRTSLIEADRNGLEELTEPISVLAAAEGLEAHRRAVVMRTR